MSGRCRESPSEVAESILTTLWIIKNETVYLRQNLLQVHLVPHEVVEPTK